MKEKNSVALRENSSSFFPHRNVFLTAKSRDEMPMK